MKLSTLVFSMLLLSRSAWGQSAPTLAQCKDGADSLVAVDSDSKFSELAGTMTAGDEIALSTKLARCQEAYSKQLTHTQSDKLDRMVYKLDADAIGRMYGFMERHHLTDKFNAEEKARRKK